MDPIATKALVSAVRPLLLTPGTSLLQRLRRPFQVARLTRKEASKRGIDISKKQVRVWLRSSPVAELISGPGDDGALDHAVSQLAWTVRGDTREAQERKTRELLELAFWSYLRILNPATAQAYGGLSSQISNLVAETQAERTRTRVHESFENNLLRFPPVLREPAVALRAKWPVMESILSELAGAMARGDVVTQWAQFPPSWMHDAPPDALAWLALVAGDHGGGATAFDLWDRAAQQGAFPRGGCIARAAGSISATDRGKARDYLRANADGHPLHKAIVSMLDEDGDGVIAAIEPWRPTDAPDAVFRLMLLATAYGLKDDLGRAIGIAVEAFENFESPGAAVLAARFLLARSRRDDAIARISDSLRAVELAIAARDRRREWGGDSAEAVDVAVTGLLLSQDSHRAWALTQTPPDGEATAAEAEDARVRAHAGMAAAMTGRVDRARRYASDTLRGFSRMHVEAVIAEWTGDQPAARDAWQRAWDSATTDVERMQAASGLVHAGGVLLNLGPAAEAFPEIAEELKSLEAANASADPIMDLRANAHKSPGVVVELAERLRASGNLIEAAETLESGANRWAYAELMAMAAQTYLSADATTKASTAARSAINLGGSQWTGHRRMLSLIVQRKPRHDAGRTPSTSPASSSSTIQEISMQNGP